MTQRVNLDIPHPPEGRSAVVIHRPYAPAYPAKALIHTRRATFFHRYAAICYALILHFGHIYVTLPNIVTQRIMNHIFAEFASPLLLIFKGLLIGIIASAPMGPVGVLCIQRTMQKGRSYGLMTGGGAALSDIIYALMTGLGMSFVMDFIDDEQNIFWLKLLGSVMLFIFGIYMFRSDPRKCVRKSSGSKGTLLHNFTTAFLVTLSNPLIIFLFIALFNMFTFVIPGNWFGQCIGYLSIIAGAMLWWLGLTYVIDKMRHSFGLRGIKRLNMTIGVIVLAASIIYACTTLFKISLY